MIDPVLYRSVGGLLNMSPFLESEQLSAYRWLCDAASDMTLHDCESLVELVIITHADMSFVRIITQKRMIPKCSN